LLGFSHPAVPAERGKLGLQFVRYEEVLDDRLATSVVQNARLNFVVAVPSMFDNVGRGLCLPIPSVG